MLVAHKTVNWTKMCGDKGELAVIAEVLTFKDTTAIYTKLFRRGHWDGCIKLYKKGKDCLWVRSGMVEWLADKVPLDVVDHTETLLFEKKADLKLREYQVEAVSSVLENRIGVISIPTGGGKTWVAAGILNSFKYKKAMYLVHRAELLWQVYGLLVDLFGEKEVGRFGAGHDEWASCKCIVAMVQTVYAKIKKKKIDLTGVDLLVVDECLLGSTRVLLRDNRYVGIKTVYENGFITEVLSYNEQKKILEPKKIIRKIRKVCGDGVYKVLVRVAGKEVWLKGTGNHKIWTNRGYVTIDSLVKGDVVKVFDGGRCVKRVRVFIQNHAGVVVQVVRNTRTPRFVYDLEVEGNHNYVANGILVSNCHHIAASSYLSVLDECVNLKVKVGLSGTPPTSDSVGDLKARGALGDVIYDIKPGLLIDKGWVVGPYVTMYRMDSSDLKEDIMSSINWRNANAQTEYWTTIRERILVGSEKRNQRIAEVVKGRSGVLIVVDLIEHGRLLQKLLGCEFVWGGSEDRKDIFERFRSGTIKILISSPILEEGTDISGIHTVVTASGGMSKVKLLQRIGRGMRLSPGKNQVEVIDMFDTGIPLLDRHSLRRKSIYEKQGYLVTIVD